MSVLNVALADIRNTPYVQIINSNDAFLPVSTLLKEQNGWRGIFRRRELEAPLHACP